MHSSGYPQCLIPTAATIVSETVAHLSGGVHSAFFSAVHGTDPSAVTSLPAPNSPVGVKLFFLQQLGVYTDHSVSFAQPAAKSDFPSSTTFIVSIPGLSDAKMSLTNFFYTKHTYYYTTFSLLPLKL